MRFGMFLAAVIACLASPVLAQTAPSSDVKPQDQRFKEYVTHPGYKQMVGQLAMMGDAVSYPNCKERKPVERQEMIVYLPPKFPESGDLHPTEGLWKDQIKVEHCGSTGYQNILIQAQTGQPPRVALLMPGRTIANQALQNTIMGLFLPKLKAEKKCDDETKIFPVNTEQGKQTTKPMVENGVLKAGEWEEKWTFLACGNTVAADIQLKANTSGGIDAKIKSLTTVNDIEKSKSKK